MMLNIGRFFLATLAPVAPQAAQLVNQPQTAIVEETQKRQTPADIVAEIEQNRINTAIESELNRIEQRLEWPYDHDCRHFNWSASQSEAHREYLKKADAEHPAVCKKNFDIIIELMKRENLSSANYEKARLLLAQADACAHARD
jgi:hypothetical protein